MSFRNVFFVGFFLNHDDKKTFASLFQCENRVFLESSKNYLKSNSKNIKYFPMRIFAMLGSRAGNVLFGRVSVDPLFKKLYVRDLKVYLTSHIDKPLPDSFKSYILYIYWVFRNEFKFRSHLSITGWLLAIKKIIKKEGVSVGLSHCDIKSIKLLAFRISFISGYLYINKLLEKIKPIKTDLFVFWGAHNTGNLLAIEWLKEKGVNYFVSEFGEIPATFSINKDGIFGDSFIAKNWESIVNAHLNNNDASIAETYTERLKLSQFSSRGSSGIDEGYLLFKTLFKKNESIKKIIYVSGVELIASGHLFNKTDFGSKVFNVNKMLLSEVVKNYGSLDGYMILYKDHPLTQKNHKKLALNPFDFPGVIFLNSMNVDNLVSMSDITITLPSKVVMTSLMHRKPVYVYGDFSIPVTVPKLGYYTGKNVADIKNIIDVADIDPSLYVKIVGQFLAEYLVCLDSPLFNEYSFENEQRKLTSIIHRQISLETN